MTITFLFLFLNIICAYILIYMRKKSKLFRENICLNVKKTQIKENKFIINGRRGRYD
jgi:hypothetical protein